MRLMEEIKGSFRDPSGFVFKEKGIVYRQINEIYKEHYQRLMESGLYKSLVDMNLLVAHDETDFPVCGKGYKIIKPDLIDFISYPYEWSFSQIKDAALTTLKIQKTALDHGMILKDASAYNIQFKKGSPIFIDTLSFEIYEEGMPWFAYRQFCQHFLAPLALISYKDARFNNMLKNFLDGIPLDLASSILPVRTKFNLSLLMHIHFHAKQQVKYSDKQINTKNLKMSKKSLLALIENLETTINKLTWHPKGTEWGDYYNFTNYTDDAFNYKKSLVEKFLAKTDTKILWDLGANIGVFSRIASKKGIKTIAFDIDPVAVEKNYLLSKENKETMILPLIMDLTNPSPALGWNNEERDSFAQRGNPDTIFALALIHHLAISNNIPFVYLARFFSGLTKNLIIEFVPKSDSQVQKLLSTRKDIFHDYNLESFEKVFAAYFRIVEKAKIECTERTLYLMERLG